MHKDGGLTLGAFNKNLDDIYVGEGCNLKKIKDAMKAINEAKRDSQEAKDILVALNLNGVGDEIADSGRKNLQRYIHKAYAGLARENLDVEHDVGKQTFKKRPLKVSSISVFRLFPTHLSHISIFISTNKLRPIVTK